MSNNLILLDTNIIIYTLKEDPVISDFVNGKKGVVSFVTEIELLGWKGIPSKEKATIDIKSLYGLKLADAFIAASAIEFNIPLVSADKVFSN